MSILDEIARGGNNRAAEMLMRGRQDRTALDMANMQSNEMRRSIASRGALEEALRTGDFEPFEQQFPIEAGNYQSEQEAARLKAEEQRTEVDQETLALHEQGMDIMRDAAARTLTAYSTALEETGDERAAAEAVAPMYTETVQALQSNPVLQRIGLAERFADAPFDPQALGAFITQTDDVIRQRENAWETIQSPEGYAGGTVVQRNALTGQERVVQGPQVVVDDPAKLSPSQKGSQIKDFESRAAATRDVINIAGDIKKIVRETPESVGWSGMALRISDDIQGAAQGLASAYGDDFKSLTDESKYDLAKYGLDSGKFNMKGVEASRYNAAIMALAYADARSQEGGGKLSEGDVKAALQRIGGSTSNPKAAITVLDDMVRRNVESLANFGEIINYQGDALDLVTDDYEKFQGKTRFPNAPPVGTVEEGHRFIGGDPSDPANWEKESG